MFGLYGLESHELMPLATAFNRQVKKTSEIKEPK
ncbi:MAG: hypothetical protein ACI9Y1_002783 [Lentisphaeria bacterium]|jgi:hypothetical protein